MAGALGKNLIFNPGNQKLKGMIIKLAVLPAQVAEPAVNL
jgi:hypothetical protein